MDTGNHGEREFAGLAAGDYTLEVKAAGADGQWILLRTPLHIHVQAPPWVRWWAWLIYALLLASIVGLVLRSWRRRLAQRHRMQLTEQQRQLAEAASAAKTQFLATLSHEIRTPMTGVMGMAELLLSTPLSPLQHDYTQAMQRSGTMLLKLLNDALDLARIEAGKLELEPAPFDPRQLLADVAQLEQGLAHAKGIRFVLEVADDLPGRVTGDALRIKQVLLNLANNALKFTEHGHVSLRAQRTSDGLQFSVSDTGPGIPEASQARLFQRFEQEDGPQRRAGSGLGLAICRELVDMMGGSIELESRVAHGSVFHVRLPLVEPASTSPCSAMDAASRSYRLLLVEDDTIVAAVIVRSAGTAGPHGGARGQWTGRAGRTGACAFRRGVAGSGPARRRRFPDRAVDPSARTCRAASADRGGDRPFGQWRRAACAGRRHGRVSMQAAQRRAAGQRTGAYHRCGAATGD